MKKYIAQPQYVDNTVEIFVLPVSEGASPVLTLGPNWSADILALTGNPNKTGPYSYFGPNSALIYADFSGVSTSLYLFVAFTSQNNNGAVAVFDLGKLLDSPPPAGFTPAELQSLLKLSDNPVGMAIEPGTGNLYVGTHGDTGNASVTVFNRFAGTATTPDAWAVSGTALLTDGNSGGIAGVVANVAFDLHGNLWATTFDSGGSYLCCFPAPPNPGKYVKLMSRNTTPESQLPSTLIEPGVTGFAPPAVAPSLYTLSCPEGIAFDPAGNLWLGNNNEDTGFLNPQYNGGGGGSLLRIAGGWLDSLLYPSLNTDASGTGLSITTGISYNGSSPITTYYLDNNSQFGGLCFDGYTLYVNDENNYDSNGNPVVWTLNTQPVADPNYNGYPNQADFEKSLALSNIETTWEGNGAMTIFNYPVPYPTLTIREWQLDNGTLPRIFPAGIQMWNSVDIGVGVDPDPSGITFRTAQAIVPTPSMASDGTATADSTNFVYVKVTNFGSVAGTGTEVLKAYFGLASGGLGWPIPWDGSYSGALPVGGVIGEALLQDTNGNGIPANTQMYFQIPWTNVPVPGAYTSAGFTDTGHFCLLARIEPTSVYPFGMKNPEQAAVQSTTTGALPYNVTNNSTIAWRNITVVDPHGRRGPGISPGARFKFPILGANPGLVGKHFTFGLQTLGRSGKIEPIQARVAVKAEGRALERLLATEFDEHRFRLVKDGRFEMLDIQRGMSRIHLPAGELLPFTVEFTPEEDIQDFVVHVIQYLVEDGVEKVFGGQTFVIGKVEGFPKLQKREGFGERFTI